MPVKKDIPPLNTESLVVDYLVVRLDLLDPTYLPDPVENPLPSAAMLIDAGIREICDAGEDTTFTFRERAFQIVKPDPDNPGRGTQLLPSGPGSACAAQIVFALADGSEPPILVRCALIKNSSHERRWVDYTFEVQFNPNVLLIGSTALPATIADRGTGSVPFPSSALAVNAIINRLPFDFLATLHQQIAGRDGPLFDARTAEAIKRGEFSIVRIRWRCNLPTENGDRFFQLLALAFGHTIATSDGIHDLATHLGLRFRIRSDPITHRVQSVVFEKRRGKHSVYSIEFSHTKKGAVSVAITAHGPAIIDMGQEAQDALKNYRENKPNFLDAQLPAKQFIERTPEQSAWWLERAIYVLALRTTNRLSRRASFAEWLVPKMIGQVLRLTSIVKCTPEGLRLFLDLEDPIVNTWRKAVEYDPKNWAFKLGFASGVGHSTVYSRRKLWLRDYNVDIEIPYVFYRDLEFFGPHSFTKPENRTALIAAVNENDGKEAIRLLVEASGNFFAQLANIVGTAISTPPILLPTKPAGNMSAGDGGKVAVVPPGRARAGEPVTPKKSLRKLPLRPMSRKPKPSKNVTAQLGAPTREKSKRGIGSGRVPGGGVALR